MKFLKRIVLALLLLPLLLWGVINGALWFGSGSISKLISKKLETEISFKHASLHILPTLGITLFKVQVGGKTPVLEADTLSASLYLKPALSGDIMPSDLHLTGVKMKEPDLQADLLKVSLDPLDLSEKDVKKGNGEIDFETLTIVDGVDHYQVSKLNGDLNLTLKKNAPSFLADLNVQGFGYSDGETVITKVNANLNDIKGSVSESGDAVVTVNLDARSIDLTNPSIHITKVERVSSPVTVKIPPSGGYKVSGPVSIKNAVIMTADREFKEVNSKIDMLVSSPLKDFKAQEIAFKLADVPGTIKTQFSMTPAEYIVGDTELDLKVGKVQAATTIGRTDKKSIRGHMKATDVNITDILKALTPDSAETYGGYLRAFVTKFSAESGHLKETLTATGSFAIDDIELKGKKISEELLKTADKTPILSPSSPSKDKELQYLLAGNFEIKDQEISLEDVKTPFKHFTVEANGGINLDKKVDLDVEVVFLEETFATLGLGIEPLKKLFGNIGKYTIPISVRGTLPDVTVKSDSAEWLQRLVGISLVEDISIGVIEAGEAISHPSEKVDNG